MAILLIAGAAVLVVVVSVMVAREPVRQDGDAGSIRIAPYSQSYAMSAGDSKKGTLKVSNTSKDSQEVIVYVRPYSVGTAAYTPDFSSIRPYADAYRWVELSTSVYTIGPKASLDIPYSLTVPADAAPGSHYGVVFAETRGRGEHTPVRVGQVLSVTVGGQLNAKGEIRKLLIPLWQSRPPVVSAATVANTGGTGLDVAVTTTVSGVFGATKHTETTRYNLLPQTERTIGGGWEESSNFGLYKVGQTVELLDQKHTNSGYVVMLPRWFLVVLIVTMLIGGGYAFHSRKNSR